MTAAVVRFDFVGGAGTIGAGVTAESGMKFNREDTLSGTSPIPIPTAAGTNYSWYKPCNLHVTTGSSPTTALTNFTIKNASAQPTGITLHFKTVTQASYAQATGGNKPTDNATTNDATPATYTAMTTSAQQWYAGPVNSDSTGLKGDSINLLLGVSYLYVSGGNSNLALQNLTVTYDEA